jgi:copper chaperone
MTDVQLQVPEVHCDHCKSSIEGAVGALPGVDTVEVSVSDASVQIAFDETSLPLDMIKATIEEQGYAVFG